MTGAVTGVVPSKGAFPTGESIRTGGVKTGRLEIPMLSTAGGEFEITIPNVRGKVISGHAKYGSPAPTAFDVTLTDVESGETDTTTGLPDGARFNSPDAAVPFLLVTTGSLKVTVATMGNAKVATLTLWIDDMDGLLGA